MKNNVSIIKLPSKKSDKVISKKELINKWTKEERRLDKLSRMKNKEQFEKAIYIIIADKISEFLKDVKKLPD